ncbi:MAG: hypothetical protein IPL08_01105 [Saprospiraceae bacterium]|nr:hypothetical protein [Saprospiraceae bacterium]
MNRFLIVILSITLLFGSCTKEMNESESDFSKGIFVVNQGAFMTGTGTITYRNGTDTIQDLFGKQNSSAFLGNIAQSMIKFGDKYFISINNAAKIQVVRANDFKAIKQINNVALPRYFAANDKKLYLSSWGQDFNSGAVHEIDPVSMTIAATISLGSAPEKMVIKNNMLYVTISANTGISKKVVVINTVSNKIVANIETSDNPTDIQTDKNGALWVLCSGYSNFLDPTLSTPGSLLQIVDDKVVAQFQLSNGANGLVVDQTGERLYFLMNSKVMAHDVSDATFENESVYDGYFYAIGIDKKRNEIYLADAKDFQSMGNTIILNPQTKTTGRFNCGIIPGFYYFSE